MAQSRTGLAFATVGIVTATIDLDQVAEARRKIPALKHDRTFPAPGRPVPQSKAGE